jgi:hypothetical protein
VRLLDLVAQSTCAAPALPPGWAFPSAHHFADAVSKCPLRLVLADDLIHCTTQLAYAEGQRLSGCLDLIHVPSQQLWLEWLEPARQTALRELPAYAELPPGSNVRRTGALIVADAAGRAGTMRTFWSTQDEEVYSAAVVTDFDLDRVIRPALEMDAVFRGAGFGVVIPQEEALDELLNHVRFRLDPAWADYYRGAQLGKSEQMLVLRGILGATAFDMPMILALFLLFAARDGLERRTADLERLNLTRQRAGKSPLLEHIELRAAIATGSRCQTGTGDADRRRGPRLHHVRGHIVRRDDKVFWRLPHLRGNARLGMVRSRTVQLSFH